jgi:hypothetical protein
MDLPWCNVSSEARLLALGFLKMRLAWVGAVGGGLVASWCRRWWSLREFPTAKMT